MCKSWDTVEETAVWWKRVFVSAYWGVKINCTFGLKLEREKEGRKEEGSH